LRELGEKEAKKARTWSRARQENANLVKPEPSSDKLGVAAWSRFFRKRFICRGLVAIFVEQLKWLRDPFCALFGPEILHQVWGRKFDA
jgi:hypothetical protein